MRGFVKSLIALTLGLVLPAGDVSSRVQETNSTPMAAVERRPVHGTRGRALNRDDRSSVIAVAFYSKTVRHTGGDCSHFVHSIYENAGFPYPYADSDDLYDGAEGFLRVEHPQTADLVVWHGHVGIVTRPSGHEFFSLLRSGPGIDDYHSRYWQSRGEPRFYRYIEALRELGLAGHPRNLRTPSSLSLAQDQRRLNRKDPEP